MTTVTDVTIDWAGKSGQTYRYWVYPIGTPMQAKGGNYIFAKEIERGRFVPIYIGQTADLDLRFDQRRGDGALREAEDVRTVD